MKVRNKQVIRRLSIRALWASRKRNVIAVLTIALTTLLFTSIFTVTMSMTSTYQNYQFRQLGSCAHGSFKEVSEKQMEEIRAHKNVRATGIRKVIGVNYQGEFAKEPAEVSFMDENCAKWSFAVPTTGRNPEHGREVAMDKSALALLGIEPRIGAQVPISFLSTDKNQKGEIFEDTFTLVGWWEYDTLGAVHYINISKEYADERERVAVQSGMLPYRVDLSVMLPSSVNIEDQLVKIANDLGYVVDDSSAPNHIRIGVSWAYAMSGLDFLRDPSTLFSMIMIILLVILTGYLVIYNIFRISVAGDVRFYGLLKTIGVTAAQLRRIIRFQALALCMIGIPIGILFGYAVGAVLLPIVITTSSFDQNAMKLSVSPIIFIGSVCFSILTVLLSCNKPGRLASKVSPIEAVRYTEGKGGKKKHQVTKGAKIGRMARANLGRDLKKTTIIIASLSLSIVLFNMVIMFVRGFDMETYLANMTCADFVVSSSSYFRYESMPEFISQKQMDEIRANTAQTMHGCGYQPLGVQKMWMSEDAWRREADFYHSEMELDEYLADIECDGNKVLDICQLEGLDESLLEKVVLLEGDLEPLMDLDQHAIALIVDINDAGKIENREYYPAIGDKVSVVYGDKESGERTVEYTVCAYVDVPYSMTYRYYTLGYSAILVVDALQRDSGQEVIPLFYLFDTPDEASELVTEEYLKRETGGVGSQMMYESKQTARVHFEQFRRMFLIIGSALSGIIGLVGILNFINAIMAGIQSRSREFAMLQAVGMTGGQLKQMLTREGMMYTTGAVVVSFVLALTLNVPVRNMLTNAYWFYRGSFTIWPVFFITPFFVLIGWWIPRIFYRQMQKKSVVERLREE